jgi:S-formylglutathione hydrolase FrmB
MHDVVFRSAALNRDMHYRVLRPESMASDVRLPVVYLLHGAGDDYRSWSNNSNVSRFAESELILVMPQGDYSYYVNAAERPEDRYENYIAEDLVSDAEARFPIAKGRANRAIEFPGRIRSNQDRPKPSRSLRLRGRTQSSD